MTPPKTPPNMAPALCARAGCDGRLIEATTTAAQADVKRRPLTGSTPRIGAKTVIRPFIDSLADRGDLARLSAAFST